MAFAFFRKHQKIVLITMIVLMVVFLIPAAFQDLITGRSSNPTIATTNNLGNITRNDVGQAQQDLAILEQSGLGSRQGMPTGSEFLLVHQNPDPPLTYALLLREAQKQGLKAGSQEIADFKDQILPPAGYPEFVQFLRESNRGYTEARIREAFANWLLITRAAALAAYDVPPSDAELRHVFRDVFEKISLRVVKISAEDLAKKITDTPPDAAIQKQFEEFRTVPPGTYKDQFSYGFGYLQPPLAGVSSLFVGKKALLTAVTPSQDDIDQFYRDYRDKTISIPVPAEAPASVPATGSAPATASAPAVEEKTTRILLGSLSLTAARPHIIRELTPAMADRKLEELLGKAEQLESGIKDLLPGQTIYEAVVAQMIQPAGARLNTKIKIPIKAMPLEQAIELMAQEAGLAKIAYPVGKHGEATLNPATKVTVISGDQGVTLQEALNQITQALEWIKIDRWVMIDGLDNVLLPIPADKQYMDIFPLWAQTTPMESMEDMNKDEILGRSVTAPQNGIPLVRLAFSEVIPLPGRQVLKADEKGPRMLVGDKEGNLAGKLLFRLVRVEPAMAPTLAQLTDNSKLKEKVVSDLKIIQALNDADRQAQQLAQAAAREGLEKAAQTAGLTTFDTGLFARKDYNLAWNDVPRLDIPQMTINGVVDTKLRELVIKKAFDLAPKQVEPTTQGYGDSAVDFVRLPANKEVVVIQRSEFQPALKTDFEGFGRVLLARGLMSSRHSSSVSAWMMLGNVQRRLGYAKQ